MSVVVEDINRSEVARQSGYTLAHISRIFSGDRNPSVACALAIAAALGMSLDELAETLQRIRNEKIA